MKTTNTGRKRVKLSIRANPDREIYVSGTFNNWDGKAKRMKDSNGTGNYAATLMLAPGEYQYKFVVDGEWQVDPECPDWAINDFGTLNNLVTVN